MIKNWPYPKWVAHRGAGASAPENTITAFQRGFDSGFRMFECDAKMSADGVIYLLHDSSLDRTTNGQGMAHEYIWTELNKLDAGSWHSEFFAGSCIPTLEEVSKFCIERDCYLNIEIKPSPGFEIVTGEQVALLAKDLWLNQKVQPLLTSFQQKSVQAAHAKVPYLPIGLLLHKQPPSWRSVLKELPYQAIACNAEIINEELIEECQSMDLGCLAYTVNDIDQAQKLLSMGVDTIITDNMLFGRAP